MDFEAVFKAFRGVSRRFEAFWASFEEDLKGGTASEMLKDMSGELEFEEMIDGLLKCRGPASKTDIIAIRRRFLAFEGFPKG